jgi:hypothetical protein
MVFSFLRKALNRHAVGGRVMAEAWEKYQATLESQGHLVSCFVEYPADGDKFWVYLGANGRVWFEDASISRRSVAVRYESAEGALGPIDRHGRPLPFETQKVHYSPETGNYFGLAAPPKLDHLLEAHPDAAMIRESLAGRTPEAPKDPLQGVPTKSATLYAVQGDDNRWTLTVQCGPKAEECGMLVCSRAARVRDTYLIFGPKDWPAAPISALVFGDGCTFEDNMAKGYGRVDPSIEWRSRFLGDDATLKQRFWHPEVHSHTFKFPEQAVSGQNGAGVRSERSDAFDVSDELAYRISEVASRAKHGRAPVEPTLPAVRHDVPENSGIDHAEGEVASEVEDLNTPPVEPTQKIAVRPARSDPVCEQARAFDAQRSAQGGTTRGVQPSIGATSQLTEVEALSALRILCETLPTVAGCVVVSGDSLIRFIAIYGENLRVTFDAFTGWLASSIEHHPDWLTFTSHGFYGAKVVAMKQADDRYEALAEALNQADRRNRHKPDCARIWPPE